METLEAETSMGAIASARDLPLSASDSHTNQKDGANDTDDQSSTKPRTASIQKLSITKKLANATAAHLMEDDDEEDNDDDDDSLGFAVFEDRWKPQPKWSIAVGPSEVKKPTSRDCYLGLLDFFQRGNSDPNATIASANQWFSEARLSVATESSSHVAGIKSLNIQPWVYAGGGLGNVDECLSLNTEGEDPLVHVCLAGGTSRDSLTFASACISAACSAEDVFADDFPERVATAGFKASKFGPTTTSSNTDDTSKFEVEYRELLNEYVTVHKRIARVGSYLNTGWVCGEYAVDWQLVPSLVWCGAMVLCALLTYLGTNRKRRNNRGYEESFRSKLKSSVDRRTFCLSEIEANEGHKQNKNLYNKSSTVSTISESNSASSLSSSSLASGPRKQEPERDGWFWDAWDARSHIKRLTHQRTETACLDGLKVGSILWVMGAHIMAIQSSAGAGYINPKDFFPPRGITTTFFGQLLFSSRFAVDTFLCVSGYLAAHVLQRKLKNTEAFPCQRVVRILVVILFRVLRILPLYLCCLGFWMFLAPHLGSGPFWYQWEHFLEPCRQTWWTNLLFVNNFWPLGSPTEATCFYHSWYLAVDVQLFCLFAPWLVLVYQSSPNRARNATLLLWLASVVGTALLAYTQGWSVHSFDGFSVALFDVEGYAKPHVRAQSYLSGIFVAFWPRRKPRIWSKGGQRWFGNSADKSHWAMVAAVSCLAMLSFVTVTGAYARRACTFNESPLEGDDCGSIWSPTANFLYAGFSRAAWSLCIALLLHLCLLENDAGSANDDERSENGGDDDETSRKMSFTVIVRAILGWRLWTPLAHLSFGAYLIHPIVIYTWFLGEREKVTFRLFTYAMEFCSITVVTFMASFVVTILVEFPLGILLMPRKKALPRASTSTLSLQEVEGNNSNNTDHRHDAETAFLLGNALTASLEASQVAKSWSYGSLNRQMDGHGSPTTAQDLATL